MCAVTKTQATASVDVLSFLGSLWLKGRHDTQHDDIQDNDNQHDSKNSTPSIRILSITASNVLLNVINAKCRVFIHCYAKCHHAECRYAECCGATQSAKVSRANATVTNVFADCIFADINEHYKTFFGVNYTLLK